MIVAKDLLIKMHFRLQIGNEHYKNPYLHTKMHYLPKKTLKVNSLFEHISTYLYHSRGVHSSPDQIVIGAGTQPLLWLLLQLLGPTKNTALKTLDFTVYTQSLKAVIDKFIPYHWMKKVLIFLVYTIQIPMSHTLHHHTNFHSGLLCLYLED